MNEQYGHLKTNMLMPSREDFSGAALETDATTITDADWMVDIALIPAAADEILDGDSSVQYFIFPFDGSLLSV